MSVPRRHRDNSKSRGAIIFLYTFFIPPSHKEPVIFLLYLSPFLRYLVSTEFITADSQVQDVSTVAGEEQDFFLYVFSLFLLIYLCMVVLLVVTLMCSATAEKIKFKIAAYSLLEFNHCF